MMNLQDLIDRWQDHQPGMIGIQRRYAVLCPFVETEEGVSVLLEVRAASLRRQPREVCFPGGRMEEGEDAVSCALRETEEELSISRTEIHVFGQSDYIANMAGLMVQPVHGLVSPAGMAALRPSPAEVDEVFTVPLTFFQETEPVVYTYYMTTTGPLDFPYEQIGISKDYRWATGRVEVPLWQYQGKAIWGMTARMIRNILNLA